MIMGRSPGRTEVAEEIFAVIAVLDCLFAAPEVY